MSGILSWQTTGGRKTRRAFGMANSVALYNETKRRTKNLTGFSEKFFNMLNLVNKEGAKCQTHC